MRTTPDEFPDYEEFVEFVKGELGDIPVLDQGAFISPKIQYYWAVWRLESDGPVLEDRRHDSMRKAKGNWVNQMRLRVLKKG